MSSELKLFPLSVAFSYVLNFVGDFVIVGCAYFLFGRFVDSTCSNFLAALSISLGASKLFSVEYISVSTYLDGTCY